MNKNKNADIEAGTYYACKVSDILEDVFSEDTAITITSAIMTAVAHADEIAAYREHILNEIEKEELESDVNEKFSLGEDWTS